MGTVGEAVAKASVPATKTVPWDPAWSRFAGLYRSPSADTEVVELNQRLVMFDPANPNPDTPINLIPMGGGRFRFEAPTGGGVVGEVIRFVEEKLHRTRATLVGQDAILRRVANPPVTAPIGNRRAGYQPAPQSSVTIICRRNSCNIIN
jgi:hypothetical protein